MRGVVLDLETNIRNLGDTAVGDMSGSPFHLDNHIVAFGEGRILKEGLRTHLMYDAEGVKEGIYQSHALAGDDEVLIIGHNIAFDLLYLLKEWPNTMSYRLKKIHIWDTAEVEYLLSGQREMYPSLDECCIKRGLPVKDDRVKEYWNQGIDTTMIPKDLLLDYLQGDVENTYAVFKSQWGALQSRPNLMKLVKIKMDDILMTTLMTWNGMHFSLEKAAAKLEVLDKELKELHTVLKEEGQKHFKAEFDFNPESPTQMSVLLFGGNYKTVEDLPSLDAEGNKQFFKGGARKGQLKTKKTDVGHFTTGMGLPTKGIPKSRDGFSTAEEHLLKLNGDYITKLLRFRELSKDAETYYRGYSKLVWPDNKIHPQRNHTSTVTGRLSCSAPNLENVSKPDED